MFLLQNFFPEAKPPQGFTFRFVVLFFLQKNKGRASRVLKEMKNVRQGLRALVTNLVHATLEYERSMRLRHGHSHRTCILDPGNDTTYIKGAIYPQFALQG